MKFSHLIYRTPHNTVFTVNLQKKAITRQGNGLYV